ncbi:MAG: peptidylprolyl isomerase [Chromatiales bacterium]|nr:MAG: peptidylprolyl isomerase [Chromatiales bacterium]
MFRHAPAILFALLLLPVSNALHAQTRELSSSGQLLDGIAAVVNDGVVLKSELQVELQRIVERLEQQGTPVPPMRQLVPQVLERLVVQRIQLQRAQRVGLQVSDETLNVALANVAQRNGVSLGELPNLLASEGIDYSVFREDLRNQITVDQLMQRDVMSRIDASEREINEYMERQQDRQFFDEEFKLSQILIATSPTSTAEEVAAAQTKAGDLLQRARAGESFGELAVAYSDGQKALEGGDLGWRKGNELPTLFAGAVPAMQAGEISDPIRSNSGFHLVRLDERRGAEPIMENQVKARHILITTNEVLDDDAAREKLSEIRRQILNGDDFAAVATAVSEDPTSAIEGGDMGWMNPRSFVPEFAAKCETLPIGELSEPFKTQFGWHIVEVQDRRIKDTTEEVRLQQAAMAIRNSKLGEETELWARRLRDQAFVEYRM